MSNEQLEREKFKAPDQVISNEIREKLVKLVEMITLFIIMIYVGFPLLWLIISSITPPEHLFDYPPTIIPAAVSMENYVELLVTTAFSTYFLNSVIVGIGATVMTTILATMGGYGLARTDFKGQRNIARSVLFAYMFPPILLTIPMYTVFYNAGLLNSYLALMFAHVAISLPFTIWLMWQYYQTIPEAFEQSAQIAGASKAKAFRDVILPMSLPGIMAVAIFTFAITWNDFTFAIVIMTDSSMHTLPVGISTIIEQQWVPWGMITAAGVLILAPCFALVAFLQRYIIQGFSVSV